jgi:hypothetical protein
MKKDILRYFINYCKDSSGEFDLEFMNRILDKGFVISNSNNEFKIPEKNFYVLGGTFEFGKLIYDSIFPGEILSERLIDNGFNNNLVKLEKLLGDDYSIIEDIGLVEVTDGKSIFINYPLLFKLTELGVMQLIQNRGIVISYDETQNNIILSSIVSYVIYYGATDNHPPVQPTPSVLQYSIFGELPPAP